MSSKNLTMTVSSLKSISSEHSEVKELLAVIESKIDRSCTLTSKEVAICISALQNLSSDHEEVPYHIEVNLIHVTQTIHV